MQRTFSLRFSALIIAASLVAGCFGDNSNGEGEGEPPPSVLEVSGPDDTDLGDSIDLTVKVKGKANEQLSVAVDGGLGTFSPQSKIVITDDGGEGTFTTRYTSGAAGLETIIANVSALASSGKSLSRALTIYDVERLGNTTALSSQFTQSSEILLAYPIVLSAPGVVRKLGIVQPPQANVTSTGRVLIGLYATESSSSLTMIAKTAATLTTGANELSIPSTALAAGTYWIVVSYEGFATYYRSGDLTNTNTMRSKTQAFSLGLDDTITGLVTSSTFYDRNFYLVLRK